MTDPDRALLFLIESFPDEDVAIVSAALGDCEGDFERAAGVLIERRQERDLGFLPQLAEMFPDVDIADLAAFLALQSSQEGLNIDDLAVQFMSGGANASAAVNWQPTPKPRLLSMGLGEFRAAVLDTKDANVGAFRGDPGPVCGEEFKFSFLEGEDVKSTERGADLRAEADLLQDERIAWLKKSAAAFRPSSLTASGQAAYFSDQGHALASRIKQLHRLAAENILEEQNPDLSRSITLDLHYLRVEEAKMVAEAFVQHSLRRSRASFSIITGRGLHSLKGSSRLGPAVWSLLKSLNVKFAFDGGSVFTVDGRCQ